MRLCIALCVFLITRPVATAELHQDHMLRVAAKTFNPFLPEGVMRELEEAFQSIDLAVSQLDMLAIIAVESGFQLDPHRCDRSMQSCKDFGLTQINYATWHSELKLNKRWLLTSAHYNIYTANTILSLLKKRHMADEGDDFITRYHSSNAENRKLYAERLKKAKRTIARAIHVE